MTGLAVVVEGHTDALILRRLLAGLVETPRFFVGRGKASVATVARNILFHEGVSVLAVVDADDVSRDGAETQADSLMALLSTIAPPDRYGAFAFRPEIEAIFFETEAFVTVAPELQSLIEGRGRAPADPKEALTRAVHGRPLDPWIAGLPSAAWLEARKGEQASAFIELAVRLSTSAS